jgi:hypothetical protein
MHLEPSDKKRPPALRARHRGSRDDAQPAAFREEADYAEWPQLAPPSPISGRAAYDLYVRHTLPFLHATGGSLEFIGIGGHYFIGPADERWDLVSG